MLDKSFFQKKENSSREEVPVIVRGYTRRRKLAILLWTAALLGAAYATRYAIVLDHSGIDYLMEVDVKFMSNTAFDLTLHRYFIHLNPAAEYAAFAASIWLGYRTLKALCIPPPIRTHTVRINAYRDGASP